MLSFLQSLSNTKFIRVVLVLIGLSFLGWQFGGDFETSFQTYVAKVNGEKITVMNYQRQLEQEVRKIRQQLGDEFTTSVIANMRLPERLMQQTMRNVVLEQHARKLGLAVSKQEQAHVISNMEAFQDLGGFFSDDQYRQALANAGLSIPQFERMVASEILRNRLKAPFASVRFTNTAEQERLAKILNESRTVRILQITAQDIQPPQTPTDADLAALYEEMQSSFITPEYRNTSVLLFDRDLLAKSQVVSDQQAKEYYQNNREQYTIQERREVRHILTSTEEEALEAIKKIKSGTSFTEVAKNISIDPISADNGGEMGEVAASDMLESFADVAFSLPLNTLSEPVKTPFGFHVIEVTKMIPGREQTFSEAKEDILTYLKADLADAKLYELIDEADEMIASGALLEDAHATVGGELIELGHIDDAGFTPEQNAVTKPVIGSLARILTEAFLLDVDIPSTLIQLSDSKYAFASVNEIIEPRLQPIAEIRDQLHTIYKSEMTERKILSKANQLLAERQSGKSFENIAKSAQLKKPIQTVVDVCRTGNDSSALITKSVQAKLVQLPQGEILHEVILHRDSAALYEVTKVEVDEIDEKLRDNIRSLLSAQLQNDLYEQFSDKLANEAKIEVNEDRYKQILEQVGL